MPSVEFYIRDYKKEGKLRTDEVRIIARFTIDREHRFEVRTEKKIEPKFWNFEKGKVKSTFRGCIELNDHLDEFRRMLEDLYKRKLPFSEFKTLAQGKE